jgi:hypothetical protein
MEEKKKLRGAVVYDANTFRKELDKSMPGAEELLAEEKKLIPSEDNVHSAFMQRKLDESGNSILSKKETKATNEDIIEASDIEKHKMKSLIYKKNKTIWPEVLKDDMAIILEPSDELLDTIDPKLFKEAEKYMKLSVPELQKVIDTDLQKLAEKQGKDAVKDIIESYVSSLNQIEMLLRQETRHEEHYKETKWLYEFMIKRALAFQYKPTRKEVFAKMRPRAVDYYDSQNNNHSFNGLSGLEKARKVIEHLQELYPDEEHYPAVRTIVKDWLKLTS